MLFVGVPGNVPLTSQQVARLMRGVRPTEIDALVRQLNATYAARNCPYEIAAEGPGYRMRLRDEHARLRDRFYGKARKRGSRRPRSRFWPSWPTMSLSPLRRSAPGAELPAGQSSANSSADSFFASRARPRGVPRAATAPPIAFWNCSLWKASTICHAAPTPSAGKSKAR